MRMLIMAVLASSPACLNTRSVWLFRSRWVAAGHSAPPNWSSLTLCQLLACIASSRVELVAVRGRARCEQDRISGALEPAGTEGDRNLDVTGLSADWSARPLRHPDECTGGYNGSECDDDRPDMSVSQLGTEKRRYRPEGLVRSCLLLVAAVARIK